MSFKQATLVSPNESGELVRLSLKRARYVSPYRASLGMYYLLIEWVCILLSSSRVLPSVLSNRLIYLQF
jgi:hypothetical protein